VSQLFGALFQAALDDIREAVRAAEERQPVIGIVLILTAFKAVVFEPIRLECRVKMEVQVYSESTDIEDTKTVEFNDFLWICLSRAQPMGVKTPPPHLRH
jgi:hypothetical protein